MSETTHSTKDNSYAYALSKTLTKVSSPATVGLYSSCQDRLNMILKQMEVYMEEEALKIEQNYKGTQRPRTPSFTGFLALISRILFFNPIWTKENLNHHNIRFIYVHFSAWHFAGSDLLWAGLVLRLFQAMRVNFGILQMVLYRVAQYDEEEEIKKKIVEDGSKDWRSRKICCCPLWLLLLCMLVVPVIILILWLTIDFPKPEFAQNGTVNGTASEVGVMEGVVIAVLGVPAVSALKFIFLMVKNLIFSQDLNIRRRMDNEQISKQLGFMNEIRKEMWYLSRFIQFMEVFERRRIRVVLKITNLDRCSPKKIVGVLDAINILLSDEESPYISILAVNPEVLIERVNFADGCFSKEDRAYAFLNRIITLPFTVPPLCDASKLSLFWHLIRNSEIQEDRNNIGHRNRRVVQNNRSFSNVPLMEVSLETNESQPLHVKDEEVEELVSNILKSNGKRLNKYLLDDVMSMRRVINSIRVTVIIMKVLKIDFECPDNIAPWVVLANQWPCRLSWIIQCVEDAQQRADIDHESMANTDNSKTLWQVFSESRAELYVMSAQIEELLEHDGDPEMFEKFLRVDFQFTIKDLKALEAATVNLDHTILKELAQLRGTSRLKDSGWMRNIAPLPIATIINMDTEDVCNELERMKYPSKYIDIVKNNNLNGSALVFGDTGDLKDLLGMNFGEWAAFRLHFLGLRSHLRQQHKNMLSTPSHSQSQLHHVPHHH